MIQWVGPAVQGYLTVATGGATIISSIAIEEPNTIVRTRGLIQVRSDQTAANEDYSGVVGRCVVTDEAVAVGISAVPTPVDASDSDLWFVYEPYAGDYESLTSVGTNEKGRQYIVDSKAMRKVEFGYDLIQVVENSATSNGTILTTFFRTLIKLH